MLLCYRFLISIYGNKSSSDFWFSYGGFDWNSAVETHKQSLESLSNCHFVENVPYLVIFWSYYAKSQSTKPYHQEP